MCAVLEISIRTYYKYRNAEDLDYYDYLIINDDLQTAAKELVSIGFKAVNEINKTEKGIEEKKLDQDFNKLLREKIQDLEKQKKPERDLDFSR